MDLLEQLEQLVAHPEGVAERADLEGDLGHHPVDLALDLLVALAPGTGALLPLAQLADLAVVLGDPREHLQLTGDPLAGPGVQSRLLRVARRRPRHAGTRPLQLLQSQQLSRQLRMGAQGHVDQPLAVLQAAGDLHLALPVEQRHRAHLAQVHAHRVAGHIEVARCRRRFGPVLLDLARHDLAGGPAPVPLRTLDHRDPGLGQGSVDGLRAAREILRQHLPYLAREQVSLALTEVDQPLQVPVALAGHLSDGDRISVLVHRD